MTTSTLRTHIGAAPVVSCDCLSPDDAEFTASPPSAAGLAWTKDITVDPTAVVTKVAGAEGIVGYVKNNKFTVEAPPGVTGCSAVFRVTTACGEAIWTVNIPTSCTAACPTTPVSIFTDSTGETTTTIPLLTPATVVSTTGLGTASTNIVGKTLTIIGKVAEGDFTIKLRNDCGECEIKGKTTAEPAAPECEGVRIVRIDGDTNIQVGKPADYCYVLAGTAPIKLTVFEGLPAGLVVKTVVDKGETKVCVSGTVAEDKCSPESGCRTGKMVLTNCAGATEIATKVFISIAASPRPPFCAGMIMWNGENKYTAMYFPPKSKLFIDDMRTCAPGAADPVPTSTTEVEMDASGGASFELPAPVETESCPVSYRSYYFRHPTCGIITNYVQSTFCYGTASNC